MATEKTTPGVRVASKRDSFRRCGITWNKAGTDVPLSEIKKADLATLRAEPMLVVTDIDIPVANPVAK